MSYLVSYGKSLIQSGVNVQYMDKLETYEFSGLTPNGKKFYLFKCNSFDKFTLWIDGKVICTRCNFITAVRLIKTY